MATVKKKTLMEVYRAQQEKEHAGAEYKVPLRKDFPQCPEFPADLTQEGYKSLGKLYSRYTAFLAYVNERIAEEKFNAARRKIQMRRCKSRIIFGSGGIKMQKLAAVHRDPEYANLTNESLTGDATLNAYSSMMWTLKDFMKAIEFETTRRAAGYRANVSEGRLHGRDNT
jgi:hypothetical protein